MSYFENKYQDKRLGLISPRIHTFRDVTWRTRCCLMNFENNLPGNTSNPEVIFDTKDEARAQLELWKKDGIDKIYVQEIEQCGRYIRIPRGGNLILPVEEFARTAALACLEAAYEVLGEVPYTGGCTAFWSPDEWIDKEGKNGYYGEACQLVLCYDGGDFSNLCNSAKGSYALIDSFNNELEKRGYYHEGIYGWCSAIYKTEHRDE